MKSLSNVGAERLGDALGESIDDGAKLSIISSYFTVFAYGELKEELSKVDEVRFLFSEPTFIKRMADSKEPREFEVARRAREVGVGGSGLELTLRNNLNQRALARECAEWIREKGVFKSAKTSGAIQPGGTYVVENPSGDDHAFMGAAANYFTRALAVHPPQVTSERASLGIDDAGVSAEGTGTSVVSVSGKVKYDLPDPIAELQDAVGLTRGTIKAILEGCSRLDEFEIDPATFLAQVGDKINRVKNDLIAQGIKYVRLPEDEWYTMRDLELDDYTAYLGQNAWKPDMTSKSLYNYVVYDSAGVERSFAEALDKQEEVLVFAKLPSAFKIDTPLGSYNPDWAYVEEADGERRVYFVTETKGGKNGEPALRDAEKIKIGCAKKHFEALDLGNDFHYNVRTTYQYEAVKA